MLSNRPQVLKYAINNHVFALMSKAYEPYLIYGRNVGAPNYNERGRGKIVKFYIVGWRTEVEEVDGQAVQNDFYICRRVVGYEPNVGAGITFYELYGEDVILHSSKLYSSPNHLCSVIRGEYMNNSYNGVDGSTMFKNWGAYSYHNGPTFTDLEDFAGWDFRGAKLGVLETYYDPENEENVNVEVNIIGGTHTSVPDQTGNPYTGYVGRTRSSGTFWDNTNLTGASLPTWCNTRAKFRAAVYSYDEDTTIYTDGLKIGRA